MLIKNKFKNNLIYITEANMELKKSWMLSMQSKISLTAPCNCREIKQHQPKQMQEELKDKRMKKSPWIVYFKLLRFLNRDFNKT